MVSRKAFIQAKPPSSQGAAYADGLLQKMDDFEERALRNMTDAQRNALLEGGFAWMKALRDAIDD